MYDMQTTTDDDEEVQSSRTDGEYTWTDDAEDEQLPGIDGLNRAWSWVEAFLSTMARPFLFAAIATGVIELLSGGELTLLWALFPVAWAMTAVLGTEGVLPAVIKRCQRAVRDSRYGAAWGWGLMAVPLLVLIGQTLVSLGYHFTTGASETEALQAIGMSPLAYNIERTLIALVVMVVAILVRPRIVRRVKRPEFVKVNQTSTYRPRNVSSFGSRAPKSQPQKRSRTGAVRMPSARAKRGPMGFQPNASRAGTKNVNTRSLVRAAWDAGLRGKTALADATGVSPSTAAKWQAVFKQEDAAR